MNETPEEPRRPDEGGGGEQAHPVAPPGDDPTFDERLDGLPPLGPAEAEELPRLDDDVPTRHRALRGGRLVAAGVAVLALVGGGVAFAVGGGDSGSDDSTDGVASIDDSEGTQDSEDGSGNGSRRPDDGEVQDAFLEYAQCMRDHGIDMADPEFEDDGGVIMGGGSEIEDAPAEGGPAGPSEEFEAADEECASILEDVRGEMTPQSPEEIAEMQDQLVAMAECMRERGYDMPDPEVSGDGGIQIRVGSGPGDAQMDGEQFNKDQEECNEEAGMAGGPLGGPAPEEDQ
jgi:hypothetical protein